MKRIPRPQRFAAVGLWTLAGNWCASELTDGAFPEWMLEEIGGTPEQAQALVEVGLWELTDEGWLFHDWLDYQPSREQVLARREATRQRVTRSRNSHRNDVTEGVTNGVTAAAATPGETGGETALPVPVPVPKEEPSSELPLRPAERPDIDRICTHLADRIQANGSKRPTITARWRDSARLMLDVDHRTEEKVHRAIDWCQDDEFWRANVLSMATLREKYDQLRLAAERKGTGNGARTDERTPSYWAKERT